MKVGIFPMVGDLLHLGHIKALEYAKTKCDYLIVALNCNPCDNKAKNKPVESIYERFSRVDSLKVVDKVIPYEGEADLLLLLQTVSHDCRFVGADHKDDYTGRAYECENGIEQITVPRSHNISSTLLRERITAANNGKVQA